MTELTRSVFFVTYWTTVVGA